MAHSSAWAAKYPNTICRLNGYDENAIDYIPVVIVGAGESGIAMGCRLKEKLGFDQFRIFDRQAGPGGTWWINRYPGVACDVPAIFYSFSFCQNLRWTSFHPSGPEIVKYLNDVASQYQITDKIQCNTDVEGATWLEDEQVWEVYLRHMVPGTGDLSVKQRNAKINEQGIHSVFLMSQTVRAKMVISAVGGLVEPNSFPKGIPGSESFKGDMFHSGRWEHSVDFSDKEVVVVGTGCSAAQFVPRLPKPPYNAKKVTQLMRSPPWVILRAQPPFGEKEWSKYSPAVFSRLPLLATLMRKFMATAGEYDWRLFWDTEYSARERKKYEAGALSYLHRTVPEKYHEILTPDYSVGCKRRIWDSAWYPGLQNPRIDLITQPLKEVRPRSVVVGPGQSYPEKGPDIAMDEREIPADVVVLANGFETTRWLHPLKVTGKGGKDLVGQMEDRGGPQAYQGTAMDNFPNFFILFGPNTATGHSSVILASENMVEFTLQFVEPILKGDVSSFEVKREAEQAYTADIQKACKSTVFNSGGCHSWYTHGDWNGTIYPYSQFWFGLRCLFPRWSDWHINYTRKGTIKRRIYHLIYGVVLALGIFTAYRVRQSGEGLSYFAPVFSWAHEQIVLPLKGLLGSVHISKT